MANSRPAQMVLRRVEALHDDQMLAIGRLECHLMDTRPPVDRLEEVEFSIFSQFGEDGILQYLLRHVKVPDTTFVEVGVGSYRESNTRFLVENNNWRGIAVNGDDSHARFILGSKLAWRYDVEPVQAFVTRDNIDQLIRDNGFTGEIGLLSIDVDGVDYWLWNAVTEVTPAIVVMEFNALFGPDAAVTVPYDANFVDAEAHYSRAYFGASLGALAHLGKERGYRLVGCSSNAANAFFVHNNLADSTLPELSSQEAWRAPRFLTSRNPDGTLSRIRSIEQRLAAIRDLPLIDVTTGGQVTVGEACVPAT
ncbi:MAG: hypothetical protein JF565_08485 [Propionibacteriales bacterium]|nr:hypothetical protein [Propionibacteriales bacterium]